MDTVVSRSGNGQICGDHYRFTLLTSRLVRMEYAPDGIFEDRPTQTVIRRDFEAPEYRLFRTDRGIELQTDALNLFYDEKPFSPNGLWIENRSECGGIYCTWHYGDALHENLGGTARTLDEADGAVPLGDGILSRLQGYSVLDDSRALVQTADGWFEPRREGIQDLYFFGYGYAYLQALQDFFRLCGATPLLPRYALGNWWSRFHAYTDSEYLCLMERFANARVPLSVAVIDMDWHITQPPQGGMGWTGYTWNRNLIADPPAFLEKLRRMGLKITLNVHPAEGAQAHEESYPAMATALGRDAARGQRIPFDAASRTFMEAYFAFLHHPREAEGVDFWWIDWQQGTTTTVQGLDPLWVLNALHTGDIGRNGKRPLILSRYAGPGSHRYPIGFSGDSVISWRTLQFQPYFTATASNIGYGWWSHDIGGHTHGKRDDELQVRWLQLGVFSPILRMHSTNNPFNGKEPWRYPRPIGRMMEDLLRLRHRLIPYLYAMNWRCHAQGRMLIEPMYYRYPQRDDAYRVPNQYFFGSELMVCPITQPTDSLTQMAQTAAWLPEGSFYDVFTGMRYQGDRKLILSRPLRQIPVLAPAGAIVPLTDAEEACANGTELPRTLEVWVFAGADGAFSLYEDDGETMRYQEGVCGATTFTLRWNERRELTISADAYIAGRVPRRNYLIRLMGVEDRRDLLVTNNHGQRMEVSTAYLPERHLLSVWLMNASGDETYIICYPRDIRLAQNDVMARCEDILNIAQVDYELKQKAYDILCRQEEAGWKISQLLTLELDQGLLNALVENLV